MQRYAYPIILIAVGLLLYAITPHIGQAPDIPGVDFINYWMGPQLALKDSSILFDIDRYNIALAQAYGQPIIKFIWSYPPHLLPLLLPFGLLPHLVSLVLWTVLWFAFYAVFALRGMPDTPKTLSLFLLALSPASVVNFGQIGFFAGGLFLGAIYYLDQKPKLTGVLLGFLTIKPQFGLIWPWILLVRRQWHVILAALLTSVVLIGLSVAIYGSGVWDGFVSFTLPQQWFFTNEPFVPHVYQLKMISLSSALRVLQIEPRTALWLQWVGALPVVMATLWAIPRPMAEKTRALLLTTAALLCTPYSLLGDLAILSPIILWRLLTPAPRSLFLNILYGLGFLLPYLVPYFNIFYVPVSPLILLALFLVALHEARLAPKTAATPL